MINLFILSETFVNQNNLNKTAIQNIPETTIIKPQANIEETDPPEEQKSSYGQILKSSAIIGGTTMIKIGIGIARTKAMALMLGPSGFGLMGLYNSVIELTQSIVGMGLNSSGVRQIAEAVGSGNTEKIARTAHVLERTSIFLGILGGVFLFGFSSQLSTLTFGNDKYANSIAILSVIILLNTLAAGQAALIQGLRRISDLARMNILGALFGTIISIPTIYFLGVDGIVISLVLIANAGLITSYWYRRKISIQSVPISSKEVGKEQITLLTLGFAFMASGLMMAGAAYVIRIFIAQKVGLDAAGLYQSAWNLGGLYVGFILDSMGTDFYPRLTAVSNNNKVCNQIVNEQAHVSSLLAGPGVIATLTIAPVIIELFYSSKFEGAIELLRWLCLGMALRIISWPMGFIILAKNVQAIFFFSELAWTIVYIGLAWVFLNSYGLNGVGIAFFGSYIFHIFMIYYFVKRLTDFRYTPDCFKSTLIFTSMILTAFVSFYFLPPMLSMITGILLTLLFGVYSIQSLLNLVSHKNIPQRLLWLLSFLRLVKSPKY